MKLPILTLALLLAAGCNQRPQSTASNQAPQPTATPALPQRWEYLVKTVDEDDLNAETERMINALGAEGWELISVSPARSKLFPEPKFNHYSRCFFKRRKP